MHSIFSSIFRKNVNCLIVVEDEAQKTISQDIVTKRIEYVAAKTCVDDEKAT